MQHAADVADNKDGTYSVSLKPEKAGPFELVLSIEGPLGTPAQKRTYAGMCIAHVAAVDKCSVHGTVAELVAGQPGKLTLARADRSGPSRLGVGAACLCNMSFGLQRDALHKLSWLLSPSYIQDVLTGPPLYCTGDSLRAPECCW